MFAFVTPSSINTLLKIIFYNCVGIKAKTIQAGYIIYPSPNFHRIESIRSRLSLSLWFLGSLPAASDGDDPEANRGLDRLPRPDGDPWRGSGLFKPG